MDIFDVKPSDYEELAKFLTMIFKHSEKYWFVRFRFIWDLNPAFSDKYERGYIIKKNSYIVGFIGKFPTKFVIDSKEGIAWNGMGLGIHPDHRKRGLGKKLQSVHFESCRGNLLFSTTPSAITRKINQSLGFKQVPHDIGHESFHAIFPVNKFKNFFLLRYFIRANYCNCFKLFISMFKNSKALKINKESTDNHIKIISMQKAGQAGQLIDQLWDKKKNDNQFTNVRTSEVLDWYLLPLEKTEICILLSYYDNDFIGYIIVKKIRLKQYNIFIIADIWLDSNIDYTEVLYNNLIYIYNHLCDAHTLSIVYPVYRKNDYNSFANHCYGGGIRDDRYLFPGNNAKKIQGSNYFTYNLGDKLPMPYFSVNH